MTSAGRHASSGLPTSHSVPGVLSDAELRDVSRGFGVAADEVSDDVVFFGGTALCRTHLPDLRLSEDIDLIAVRDRSGRLNFRPI